MKWFPIVCLVVMAGCAGTNSYPQHDPPDDVEKTAMSLALSDCTTFLSSVPVDEQWARQQLPPKYTLATLPAGQTTMTIWSSECAAATVANDTLGPFKASWAILAIASSNDVLHPMGFAVSTTLDASPKVVQLAQRVSPEMQTGEVVFSADVQVEVDVHGPQSSYQVSGAAQSPSTTRFLQNVTILHANGTMWMGGIVTQDDATHASTFEPMAGSTTDAPLAGAPLAIGTGRESRGDYEFALTAGFIDDATASRW